MRLFLLLVTLLLLDETFAGHRTPHRGKRKGRDKDKGDRKLNDLHHKLDKLDEGQDDLAEYVHSLKKSQGAIHGDLDKLIGLQGSLTKTLHVTFHVLESAQNNTDESLRRQAEILDGQQGIEDLVAQEHAETRAQVQSSQDAVQADLAKVSQGQQTILDKIQENEDIAENAILDILQNEDDIQKELKNLQQDVADHATANQEGQAQIVEDVRSLHTMLSDDIDKVLEGQDEILDELDKSQNAVESGLHKVLDGQKDIQDKVKDNQQAVQSELAEVKNTQEASRDLIDESVGIVQEDITIIMKGQEVTQNLLQSCGSSSCDVGEAVDVIHQIKKQIANARSALEKDIKGIVSEEMMTQGKVETLEATLHEEIQSNHEETDKKVEKLSDDLDDFGKKSVEELQDYIVSDTEEIKSTQESIEHNLKKILADLDTLTAGKVGIGVKKAIY